MTDSPTRQRAPLANTECLDVDASRVVDDRGHLAAHCRETGTTSWT